LRNDIRGEQWVAPSLTNMLSRTDLESIVRHNDSDTERTLALAKYWIVPAQLIDVSTSHPRLDTTTERSRVI
jgi:hypothetical protein